MWLRNIYILNICALDNFPKYRNFTEIEFIYILNICALDNFPKYRNFTEIKFIYILNICALDNFVMSDGIWFIFTCWFRSSMICGKRWLTTFYREFLCFVSIHSIPEYSFISHRNLHIDLFCHTCATYLTKYDGRTRHIHF